MTTVWKAWRRRSSQWTKPRPGNRKILAGGWMLLLLMVLLLTSSKPAHTSSAAEGSSSYPSFTGSAWSTRVTGHGSRRRTDFTPSLLLGGQAPWPADPPPPLYICQPTTSSSTLYIYLTQTQHTVAMTLEPNGTTTWTLNPPEVRQHPRTTSSSFSSSWRWMPVQGLLGRYQLPSGPVWVWIVSSTTVYQAPSWWAAVDNDPSCWWTIQRVQQLHLVQVPRPVDNSSSTIRLTRTQRQEERRQLSLWRQAWKHHAWYHCGGSATTNNSSSSSSLSTDPMVTDMTHRLQTCFQQPGSSSAGPQRRAPDARFFWNQAGVEPLQAERDQQAPDSPAAQALSLLLQHVIPVTSAFVGLQRHVTLTTGRGGTYDQLLVTRRSQFRAGTRFTKRGADAAGQVANYAETEQILFLHHHHRPSSSPPPPCSSPEKNASHHPSLAGLISHVQTRGSIPLRWSSPTDIKTYRPRVRIGTDPLAQARALRQHLVDQASRYMLTVSDSRRYPGLILVNLVDKKSDQGRLGRALEAVLSAVLEIYDQQPDPSWPWLNSASIQHVWYDFHAQVKHGRWDRLADLLEQVQGALVEQGYLCVWSNPQATTDNNNMTSPAAENGADGVPWQILRLQDGCIRTNCMDCLDRTNVVQSVLARSLLFSALSDPKIGNKLPLSFKTAFRKNPLSLPWVAGEVAHRMLWADNADEISRLYAGTPALKGDFTRIGKRTKKGAWDDGMNSLQRYYLNNFLDADRQEGIDLLTGNQPFNNVGDSTVEDYLIDSSEDNSESKSMTIQQAVRRMMLDMHEDKATDDSDADHVRIKVDVQQKLRLRWPNGGRGLELRWLPGDLKDQVRSLLRSPILDSSEELSSRKALESIDQRTESDLPWWVTPDEVASSPHHHEPVAASISDAEVSGNINSGYLIGALVAGTQAPWAVASVLLVLASLALSTQLGSVEDQDDSLSSFRKKPSAD